MEHSKKELAYFEGLDGRILQEIKSLTTQSETMIKTQGTFKSAEELQQLSDGHKQV